MRNKNAACRYPYQKPNRQADEFSPPEKKRLYALYAILFLIVLAGVVFVPRIGAVALHQKRQQVLAAQGINAKLKTDNEQGQKSIDAAKKDPEYLEGVARAEYNMVQPDEVILDYSKKK
jgi:cell division protein FtsB